MMSYRIIGCAAFDSPEYCAHVILQGGVRGLITVLNQTMHPRRVSGFPLPW